MQPPRVSVVIPAYNAAPTLGRTLESVLKQTFASLDVIVVDDGSTDDTAEIAQSTGDVRVKVIQTPNGGVSRARNRGMAGASGELIALLDADDLWLPDKLEKQVNLMDAEPDIGVSFTAATRVDESGSVIGELPALMYDDYSAALLLYSVVISAADSTAVIRRDVAEQLGGFDPNFSQCADWDYFLRASRVATIAPLPEPLVLYWTAASNMSRDIALLERDTFAVLRKTFDDPEFAAYVPIRRRVYSNHWMICSGSYLHAGLMGAALRCLVHGLAADPSNLGRPLGLPRRWLQRLRISPGAVT
jgi:glycosyltransferase involved in cell wall biosynthesis